MNVELKELRPEDVQYAKDLFTFFQIDDGIERPVIPPDEYLFEILSRETFHVITAIDAGSVIGGLTAYELDMYKEKNTEIFLYEIAVSPSYRNKGIGRQLITFLKKICISKGIAEMYVGAEINNYPAIKLYKSSGGKLKEIAWFEYELY